MTRGKAVLQAFDYFDGVRARLSPDIERNRWNTIKSRKRSLFLCSVFNATDVAKLDGRAVHIRDDEIVKLARVGKSSERAKRELFFAGSDVSAGHVCVLTFERLSNLRD